jgi:hypothetical protein
MLSDTGGKLLLNGFAQVGFWTDEGQCPWFIWKLIPMNVESSLAPSKLPEPPRSDPLPSYDGYPPGSFPTSGPAEVPFYRHP